ncbi:MAG TPA: cytochrome b/b6 domain-containing protein [Gemmatimonadota bacterium]|nr:cytochrome b/b6 domain-containing protein [Gemmatimonadota bacterium]
MARRVRFFQPLAIRLTHWLNLFLLLGMIASGLQIFGAYPAFAERGAVFCCYPFDGVRFPEAVRLGGWLGGGLRWHFFLMWFFVLNGLVYIAYLTASGEWRRRLFFPRDARGAWQMQLYYLKLRKEKPEYEMYNGLQKLSYTGTLALGALSVVTGLALWKPVSLPLLTWAMGGYVWARFWHFLTVWGFVGFLAVHLFMTLVVDRESTRSMIVGPYREKPDAA